MHQRPGHDQDGRGGPEQVEGEYLRCTVQVRHDPLLRPFARQQRRRRRAQNRDELDQRAESLGAGELFGSHQAEQEHEPRCREHGDEAENVAGAAGGEDVHQQERGRRSDHAGNDEQRHEDAQRHQREQQPAVVHPPVGHEDRYRQERDHPARVQHRLDLLRPVHPQPVHRRRHDEIEVLCEEEGGQCRDDVRQEEDRQKSQQHHAQQLAGEERADLGDAGEVAEQLHEQREDHRPEGGADRQQHEQPQSAPLVTAGAARPRRQPLGREQQTNRRVGERRRVGGDGTDTERRERLRRAGPIELRR